MDEWLEPKQFDAFWRHAKDELREIPFTFQVHHISSREGIDEIGDFSYRGAKKEKVYGFYLKHKEGPRPTMLMFHGYGWHKGNPEEYLDWYQLGVNVFAIDIRGQKGQTMDRFPYPSGDHRLMTRGLGYPEHYYLKHVYQDGLQLIELVKTLDFVDPKKVILHGGSQGGGIVFALAGLTDVYLTFADVPSYSYFKGRIETRNGSIREIADYMNEFKLDVQQTYESLKYFDLMFFAPRIKAPMITSVGLKDEICPARYFMKAFERLDVDREIYEYPEAGHEGGAMTHHRIKLELLEKYLNQK
ncbi:MAG: acetylxylan esterase [Acholeplasmataceae bacterium]|nr:acetylxylan esterase [Acholeplasmataceae bacterium]